MASTESEAQPSRRWRSGLQSKISGAGSLIWSVGQKNMKIERTDTGLVELRISDDSEQFKHLAEEVRNKLGGRWIEKLDGLDQSYWDLDVQGEKVTVHREHYEGVSVFCDDQPAKISVLERLQTLLERG